MLSHIPLSAPYSLPPFRNPSLTKTPPAKAAPPPQRIAASPTRKRPPPVELLPAKKRAAFPAENCSLPKDLGECISRDVELLQRVGWQRFVEMRRHGGDLSDLENVDQHPAKRLLKFYKHWGVPVKFSSPKWSRAKIKAALTRGAHKSCNEHIDFLNEEFVDMIQKWQWVILPATMAMELEGLRLLPPGVISQRDRRPRWICDYT